MSEDASNKDNKKPPVIRRKATNSGGLPHPKIPGGSDVAPREENGAAPPRVNLKRKTETLDAPAEETARISVPGAGSPDLTEKIDLPAGAKTEETERIQISAANESGAPEKDRTEHVRRMSQTDRIELSAAKKPGETARIEVASTKPAQDTDRIDLAAAKPPGETARIDMPEPPSTPSADDDDEFTAVTLDPEKLKQAASAKGPRPSTDRIDLAETIPMEIEAPEAPPAAKPIAAAHEDLLAASTVPIESLSTKDRMAAETVPIESVLGKDATDEVRAQGAALMNQTMRVELSPEEAKGETARLDELQPAASPSADAPATSRVELPQGATNGEDVLRRAAKGAAMAGAAAVGAAKEPPSAPATPPEEEAVGIISPPRQPKPGTARIEVEPPTKSATARIEVDESEIPHAPPRPKSIKLKRAEGAGKKSDQPAAVAPPPGKAKKPATDASFGPFAGVAAVATVFIMVVLIYVLAAQTIATNLPFPGRM